MIVSLLEINYPQKCFHDIPFFYMHLYVWYRLGYLRNPRSLKEGTET